MAHLVSANFTCRSMDNTKNQSDYITILSDAGTFHMRVPNNPFTDTEDSINIL